MSENQEGPRSRDNIFPLSNIHGFKHTYNTWLSSFLLAWGTVITTIGRKVSSTRLPHAVAPQRQYDRSSE